MLFTAANVGQIHPDYIGTLKVLFGVLYVSRSVYTNLLYVLLLKRKNEELVDIHTFVIVDFGDVPIQGLKIIWFWEENANYD